MSRFCLAEKRCRGAKKRYLKILCDEEKIDCLERCICGHCGSKIDLKRREQTEKRREEEEEEEE